MSLNVSNAIDFTYLLIDYYKELGITNDELVVLLMSNHLISCGDNLITNNLLELKLNMKSDEIDKVLDSLFTKKLINYQTINGSFVTTLDPLKEILFKKYREQVLKNDPTIDQEKEKIQKKIYKLFSHYFERSFSNVEYAFIDKWIDSGASEEMIANALVDAIAVRKLSFNYIDAIIRHKLEENEQ